MGSTPSKELSQREFDQKVYLLYSMAGIFTFVIYMFGSATWVYLQRSFRTLDDIFLQKFLEDHCKDQVQLSSHSPAVARFTLDNPIDPGIIPDDESIRVSRSPFTLNDANTGCTATQQASNVSTDDVE